MAVVDKQKTLVNLVSNVSKTLSTYPLFTVPCSIYCDNIQGSESWELGSGLLQTPCLSWESLTPCALLKRKRKFVSNRVSAGKLR